MSLKYRIMAAILGCAFLSAVLVSAPLYMGTQDLIEEGSKRELAQAEARLRSGLQSRIDTALAMAQTVAAIPRVQRAVKSQDTKGLHRLFVKDFAAMSAATGVAQFQFHSPQAVSILRVHKPEHFGDDLSEFRAMVVEANRDHLALSGLERGRAGLGIRGIAPVSDDGDHLGTVEIGLSFDADLMNRIVEGSDVRIEVYILPDQSITTFAQETTEIERISGNYTGAALLTRDEIRQAVEEGTGRSHVQIEGGDHAGLLFPIADYSGAPVALAHVLMPTASYATISGDMTQLALQAVALAMAFCAVMAWIFGARLTRVLWQLVDRLGLLVEGRTEVELDDLPKSGEMGRLAEGFAVFRDRQREAALLRVEQETRQEQQEKVVARLAGALKGLASGNLETRITEDLGEGYAQLATDFNAAATGLSDVISAIAGVAATVSESAYELRESAQALSSRTETSAATLEQTAAALEQVTATVRTTSDQARMASEAGSGAIDKARSGADVVHATVRAMGDIDDSAEEIARITGLIDEIAFQTNLLALNAGVEAARAGSAGSGFAVVASEVQALAQRTANAAGQIGALIATSGEKVKHGVLLVNRTGKALDEIVAAVEAVTGQISHIAQLAGEQQQSLSEVNVAVTELDQTTQRNAAMFHDTKAANQALMDQGSRLQDLVGKFRSTSDVTLFDESAAA